jgi:hypothetical protein
MKTLSVLAHIGFFPGLACLTVGLLVLTVWGILSILQQQVTNDRSWELRVFGAGGGFVAFVGFLNVF